MTEKELRLGKLPPKYYFVLNPHPETRVSTCPMCERQMRQRKLPLLVHVQPAFPVVLGYTCRYCPDCDLLVAHRDELERYLAGMLSQRAPEAAGNDFLVLGTVERDFWLQGMRRSYSISEVPDHLHDFIEVWTLELRPAGWYHDDTIAAEKREIVQARAEFAARRARSAQTGGAGETQAAEKPSTPAQPTPRRQGRKRSKKR